MRINFYHFGVQCPIIYEMLQLFQNDTMDIVKCIDISNDISLAPQPMYYPFLTIIDEKIFWYAPLTLSILEQIRDGKLVKDTPYQIIQSTNVIRGEILYLTDETIIDNLSGCTMCKACGQINAKRAFLQSQQMRFYGILHKYQGKIVGGAEWLPSMKVPYPIPKDNTYAFITCVYHSSENYDYKAYPLAILEKELSKNYQKIFVISDEIGIFPNGPMSWFIRQGYKDLGIVQEIADYACLHLMSKDLKS